MHQVIAIFGFFGAWLLVAGPLFQAYLELREQEIDHEGWQAANNAIPKEEGFSPWWWLLPPVASYKQQKRNRRHQQDVLKVMDQHATEQAVTFFNKANGWFIVAGGAALLAVKETAELVDAWDWPIWVFWILVVICPILCVANLAARSIQSERMLGHETPTPRSRHSKPVS